ncbi:LptA/OstA family protein [Ensifer adhaerens]|jgi:lipopolysaccharide export system protein LptA|uniref:LptA/OstA family protein n=1 Tax=Ensifer TaxID=106591 RepID=UPI000DE1B095|nr:MULTISPECIES: LptA/OstA family protein [Ensifer]MBK5564949.1 LptA/OstA family protein [Ensifer sp. SSB1]MBZ7920189.1 LptA/OstA family protein [Ensifer adhaerens]UAX92685.1 LptA/OstA family protein [Ensifer adhaerens]UAY00321.1 LptA/OstA family protein [Ensifer adhaerens]UAY07703.1 LptA/OstA family protein [Ensifer adhaerens]
MSVTTASLFKISASLAIAGAGALIIASGAFAQATSSKMKGLELSNDKPIQIESDKLEIKDPESKAIFTGNVKVVQGTTTLQAGNMVVFYKSGGGSVSSGDADIDRIEVSEKVFLSSGTQQATADTGSFDMTKQIFVLKGDKVVLSEGKNVFVGCQLNVQMETGEAQLEACGGRVQIQLDPKSRKPN